MQHFTLKKTLLRQEEVIKLQKRFVVHDIERWHGNVSALYGVFGARGLKKTMLCNSAKSKPGKCLH